MTKYILKRIVLIFFTLFIILSLSFILIKLLPSYPPLDPNMPEGHWEALQEKWGYDKPIVIQYGKWLKNVLFEWNWGMSTEYRIGENTFSILTRFLPITMRINIISFIIVIPLGIILGIIAALKKNKITDHIINIFVILFISVPSFVIVTFMMLKARDFGLPTQYPSMDAFTWKALVIPVIALSFGPIASLTRYTRAELVEVLTSDFLLLARTKGLNRFQSTTRHALRNSMVPLVPIIVSNFIGILFGSLIIEQIYSVPGVGDILIKSISLKDYNLTMTSLAFYTIIGLFATLLIDISYGIVDPRIRMGVK